MEDADDSPHTGCSPDYGRAADAALEVLATPHPEVPMAQALAAWYAAYGDLLDAPAAAALTAIRVQIV